MASWMVHLRVADKLMDKLGDIDETAFVVGNIAPDSGVPNEDWSVYTPPKEVSHFKKRINGSNTFDIDEFKERFFNEELIKNYSRREYSFFLGYYVHLLTDNEWRDRVLVPLADSHPEEAATDRNKLVWTAKGDWYDIDFRYLKEHPEFRAFSLYEKAVGFENTFMDMFSRDAFDNRRQYICGYYRSDEHGDLYRNYEYLTPEQSSEFVDETVEVISRVLVV
ncbi:MAG: hypothetical protein J5626_03110 [Lachnospiraceae bacterium]|nr:hypothetical protein [Lachnospiraceae bacterium]